MTSRNIIRGCLELLKFYYHKMRESVTSLNITTNIFIFEVLHSLPCLRVLDGRRIEREGISTILYLLLSYLMLKKSLVVAMKFIHTLVFTSATALQQV